jgi:hypothetical protein
MKEFCANTVGKTPKRIDHQEHSRFFDACFDIGVHDGFWLFGRGINRFQFFCLKTFLKTIYMASVRALQLISDQIKQAQEKNKKGPSIDDVPKSSLQTFKKVRNDLSKIYSAKCMDEYYIHYEECEAIRHLLFDYSFD